jgi:type 1 glutamine amidotransferase
LASFGGPSLPAPPKKLLLLGQGPDGHPPTTHEYMAGLKVLAKCLKAVPGVEVTVVRADEPWAEGPKILAAADGVVIFLAEGAKWARQDPRRQEALAKLAARGGGMVALHWGIGTKDKENIAPFLKLLGGCHGGPDRKYKVLETEARVADPRHPIAAGITSFKVRDEFYYRLKFVEPAGSIRPVLKVPIEGQEETVAWSWERRDGGRSFGFSGLHFHDNWRLLAYRRLVAQGVLWTLKIPIPEKGLAVHVTDEDLKLSRLAPGLGSITLRLPGFEWSQPLRLAPGLGSITLIASYGPCPRGASFFSGCSLELVDPHLGLGQGGERVDTEQQGLRLGVGAQIRGRPDKGPR